VVSSITIRKMRFLTGWPEEWYIRGGRVVNPAGWCDCQPWCDCWAQSDDRPHPCTSNQTAGPVDRHKPWQRLLSDEAHGDRGVGQKTEHRLAL